MFDNISSSNWTVSVKVLQRNRTKRTYMCACVCVHIHTHTHIHIYIERDLLAEFKKLAHVIVGLASLKFVGPS